MADLATQLHDDPNNYINDPNVEIAWAMKAAERASVHMNLIMATDTRALKLTKHQEEMHKQFREAFPSMDVEKVSCSTVNCDIVRYLGDGGRAERRQ